MLLLLLASLGLNKVAFQPYSRPQLQDIISFRLASVEAFGKDAIGFCAGKVASVSGDARRALQICRCVSISLHFFSLLSCTVILLYNLQPLLLTSSSLLHRRAAEIAEGRLRARQHLTEASKLVTLEHIDAAINEMTKSPFVLTIQSSTLHEKVWICSLLAELRRSGASAPFSKVMARHHYLCNQHMISRLRNDEETRWKEEENPDTDDEVEEEEGEEEEERKEREEKKKNRIVEKGRMTEFPLFKQTLFSLNAKLASSRLIIAEGPTDYLQQLRLNVEPDDVMFALHDEEMFSKMT
jgi:hypothetical protein